MYIYIDTSIDRYTSSRTAKSARRETSRASAAPQGVFVNPRKSISLPLTHTVSLLQISVHQLAPLQGALSISHHTLSISLSHTHTHSCVRRSSLFRAHPLSLSLAHTHNLSLAHTLALSHTHSLADTRPSTRTSPRSSLSHTQSSSLTAYWSEFTVSS